MTDENKMTDLDLDHGVPADTDPKRYNIVFNTRRKMAIACLVAMFVVVGSCIYGIVPTERAVALSSLIENFFYVMGGVIAAYFGFSMAPWFGRGKS